jgi:hypothetical protein
MAIPSKFTLGVDPKDTRTFLLRLQEAVTVEPAIRPGLKAIRLRASVLNPNKAGDYPVLLTFENAGELTGASAGSGAYYGEARSEYRSLQPTPQWPQ